MRVLKALLPTVAAVIFAVGISHADFMYRWSQTAGSNANSDTFTWAEGQAPSTVNDSARGMMAAIAKFRDDTSGKLVTTGTATAYVLATNSVFNTLAAMDGAMLSFRVNVTSGAAPTLNVDTLGAKALNQATGVAVATGALINGAIYRATYVNATNEWIVQGVAGVLPSGTSMVVAQTTCPAGWTKGSTHNDKALRVVTGTASSGGTNAFSVTFGQTVTGGTAITTANLPVHSHPINSSTNVLVSTENLDHTHNIPIITTSSAYGAGGGNAATGYGGIGGSTTAGMNSNTTHTHTLTGNTDNTGSGTAHTHPFDTRVQYVDVVLCTLN